MKIKKSKKYFSSISSSLTTAYNQAANMIFEISNLDSFQLLEIVDRLMTTKICMIFVPNDQLDVRNETKKYSKQNTRYHLI